MSLYYLYEFIFFMKYKNLIKMGLGVIIEGVDNISTWYAKMTDVLYLREDKITDTLYLREAKITDIVPMWGLDNRHPVPT